ncbi:cytochrome c oxidase assembly protein, partial [Streptomyces sp. NPDC089915]|uniref:cytochrome c oxidase assembly protein n=1 Tax=Streptomyces sp. NPDC089915 TaxID=3155186 RepID=UPI0034414FBA
AVMTHGALIAGAWYAHHAPSWAPDVQREQQVGGGAMIGVAELVTVCFLLVILAQWFRTERDQALVLDRRLETELVPAAAAVPGQERNPDLVRPWWETEGGEVADRIRQRRP